MSLADLVLEEPTHWLQVFSVVEALVEGLTDVERVVLDHPNQLLCATGVVLAFSVLELELTHDPQVWATDELTAFSVFEPEADH